MNKLFVFLVLFIPSYCYAQTNADAIIGKWLKLPKENLIIEVYKVKDEYRGKINWTKEVDAKKPVGYVILQKLMYSKKAGKWINGKITDPNNGKTYTAEARITPQGELEVNGYIGFSFFGIKRNFKRL